MAAAIPVRITQPGGRVIAAPASFSLVSESEVSVPFSATGRVSPYRQALEQLDEAEDGKVLCFDSIGARPQITAQAKKLGLRVLFAEQEGKLYAKLAGAAPKKSPRSVPATRIEGQPASISDAVRMAVSEQPRTNQEVQQRVADLGFPNVSSSSISALLGQQRDRGFCRKDNDLKWVLAARLGKGDE